MHYHVNELTPVLETVNMQETIKYYTEVLGFNIDFTYPSDDNPLHVGFSIGGHPDDTNVKKVHFHLSKSDDQKDSGGWLFINVNEVDEIYTFMQSQKAKISVEIDDFPWGYREFEIEDPNGNKFRFTKNLHHH